jgi:hypothetical protein
MYILAEESSTWEMIHHTLEALGLFFIPFVGWTLVAILNHSKQIVVLESKVNDSLDRRMLSIENKVTALEGKLEAKIDSIEHNVTDCKLSINTLITEKFDHLLRMVEERRTE